MQDKPLAHGAYDLSALDERILDGRIQRKEIEKVVYEMQKSEYWIPCFTSDGRAGHGYVIAVVMALWIVSMLALGGFHNVIGLTCLLVSSAFTLLACFAAWGISVWVSEPLRDTYLNQREKNFTNVVEQFNNQKQGQGVKLEVGRYAAYLILRFSLPIRDLGVVMMHYARLRTQKKEEEVRRSQFDEEIL